jgi:AraC-like DNA-binding protein
MLLCHRHVQRWIRTDEPEVLSLAISDTALRAACDEVSADTELRGVAQLVDPRVGALVAAVNAERIAGFPSGRMFRESTGETPHQFVVRQRIERAKEMLREGEIGVLDGVIAPPDSTPGWAALRDVYSNTSRKKSTVVCHDLASVCGCCPLRVSCRRKRQAARTSHSRGSEQASPKFNTDRTHPATMTDREVRIQQ